MLGVSEFMKKYEGGLHITFYIKMSGIINTKNTF